MSSGYQLGEEWQKRASCLTLDPEDFVRSGTGRPPKSGKQACKTCPVRAECLEFALSSPWRPQGTWGGLGQGELKPLWTKRHSHDQAAEIRVLLGLA